jgi:4-hydroxybutyryl-CoA dehydratase/vinylacetyl-CoA-Delta-isomerase
MPIKTREQYIESLRKMNYNVYFLGERIENPVDHPVIRPSAEAVALTYELANVPEYQNMATAKSHLTGKTINRFTHIHQSSEDLVTKVKLQRLLGQMCGVCFQRCVGMDAINALSIVTYDTDQALGTSYYQRFNNFLKHIQENDLVCDGAMTDPKGDRRLRPHQQADPDMYLRVVEKTANGIVVRGAKVHQTGALNSHEIIVMPTINMTEEDEDYAVSFAMPSDTKGITYVYGRQSCDTRALEEGDIDLGNAKYGGHESLVIFNDVFVPWERVFMCGEYQFSGSLVEKFGGYHRQSYGGCKAGVGDVLIGAAATMLDYNGLSKASHSKDKLVEMIHLNETIYSGGLACSYEGKKKPSGTCYVDNLLANVCKQNVTRFPYEIARIAQDLAGGLMATMPSEKDFRHPEVGKYIEKYLKGADGVAAEPRMRVLRLIENLTMGRGAVGYLTESMHGAGSPQAQRIMINREARLENKKKLAKALAGVRE